jgi:pSer/pThr/pTyr-binding forkhead associated (FHA) protein
MSLRVTITAIDGGAKTNEYTFDRYAICLVGRAIDCDIRIPTDPLHTDVSRYHCRIEIDSPRVTIHDLGSLNGTFVNGELIGGRRQRPVPGDTVVNGYKEVELKDGDEIRIGLTTLVVDIQHVNDGSEERRQLSEMAW